MHTQRGAAGVIVQGDVDEGRLDARGPGVPATAPASAEDQGHPVPVPGPGQEGRAASKEELCGPGKEEAADAR